MPSNKESSHKAGFVTILGRPNVGKSTLMNAMVGEKLSIITAKAQTTRHRIHGIVNGEDYQVVFSDTPSILDPAYKLQESMLRSARQALTDADVILYLTEPGEKVDASEYFLQRISKATTPVLLLINKIDLTNQEALEELVDAWKKRLPKAEILPMSALKNFNVKPLFKRILELIPSSPPYYPKDMLTNKSERFLTGEMIREKVLLYYRQEIPYSVEVEIEEFKEEPRIIRIRALIYVEKESQKGILIGHQGAALKKVGKEARETMEKFFGKKIFLELFVKVRKDWRNNENTLKKFGYR